MTWREDARIHGAASMVGMRPEVMSHRALDRPQSGVERLSAFASLLLAGSAVGFEAVSYLPDALGVDSRAVTIPFRALLLGLFLVVLFLALQSGQARRNMQLTTPLLVFFWLLYTWRFVDDALISPVPLGTPAWEMGLYLFGTSLPAIFVFYQIREIRVYEKAFPWITLIIGACCALSLVRGRPAEQVMLHGGGYEGNAVLNHITYGHMGVQGLFLGIFLAAGLDGKRRSPYFKWLAIAVAGLGLFSALAAASKGALVAGLIVVPVVIFLALRRSSPIRRTITIIILAAGMGYTGVAAVSYLSKQGVNLERLVAARDVYTSANASTRVREILISNAWEQYLDHPVLGSSMVERQFLSYPHNAFVEAFMATGTFGGIAFALVVLMALRRAVALILRCPSMAWIPLLFIQELIAAMFSSGLYYNPLFWGTLGITLGVTIPRPSYAERSLRFPVRRDLPKRAVALDTGSVPN